jgi:hypothetical protein
VRWSTEGVSGRPAVRPVLQDPTTPTPQPLTGITQHRFSHHPLSFAQFFVKT